MKSSLLVLICIILFACQKTDNRVKIISDNEVISISEVSIPIFQYNQKTINVFGPVKEILCTKYIQYVPNSELDNYVTKMNYKFDKKGNITQEVCFLEDQKFNYFYKLYYDNMNNKLITEGYDKIGNLQHFSKTKLNQKGFRIEDFGITKYQKNLAEKEVLIKNIDKYNYIEQSTSAVKYTIKTHKYINDSLIEQSISSDTIIEIYENNNLIRNSRQLYGEEKINEEKKYDKFNNLIEEKDYVFGGKRTYKYDKNNKLINVIVEIKGRNVKNELTNEYDGFGNITKQIYTENGKINSSKTFLTSYKYDKCNNWVIRYRTQPNGKKISILERKITYY